MRLRSILLILSLVATVPCTAQFVWFDSIPVIGANDTLVMPWAGGFNSPIFSQIDLNFDGIDDLFVLERKWDARPKTFLNIGTPNQPDYRYAPEYRAKFPQMWNWALLRDYNCDGKKDIFCYAPGGAAVYRNDGDSANGLQFTLIHTLLMTEGMNGPVNLYISITDLPAIADIDDDGDLDILSFDVVGSKVKYHRNYTMEDFGNCDTLKFFTETHCWGNFLESTQDNSITLNISCRVGPVDTEYELLDRHSGSSLLTLDMDMDQDKELVMGDVSFQNLLLLTNGGDLLGADMVAVDMAFPSNTVSTDLEVFPGAFYLDVDNDSINELIVSPQSLTPSKNVNCVWYYENNGANDNPDFSYVKNSFMQEEMIDIGEGTHAVFFDANADSLQDIILSNTNFFEDTCCIVSRLSLLLNVGTVTDPVYKVDTNDYAGLSALNLYELHPAFGDLDGDGDEDMIVGDNTAKLHYYENTAGAGNPAVFTLVQSDYKGISAGFASAVPQIVDVNRDGLNDLLIGEMSGEIRYHENIGTQSVADFSFSPTVSNFGEVDVEFSTPYLAEDDSSGEYVLFVGSELGWIYYYTDIDNNLFGDFTLVDSINTFSYRVNVHGADITGNGRTELIIGEHYGGAFIMKNASIPFGIAQHTKQPLEVLVYPNPSDDFITVDIKGRKSGDVQVRMTDVLGRQVFARSWNRGEFTIPTATLAEGVYLLMVTAGSQEFSDKVVVLH